MWELGFSCSDYDCCLYIKTVNQNIVGFIFYVDDLLVFSQEEKLVAEVKNKLKQRFRMTNLGPIKNYLGIAVNYDRNKRTMELCPMEYVNSLAEKYQVDDMRKFKTPMEKNLDLPYSNNYNNPVSDYRRLVEVHCCL